jgi:methylene-fatty-acyl-phospholipid synthase
MQLVETLNSSINFVQEYINFSEEKFIETLLWSLLCWASWVIFPHLQFRYKIISRFTNGDMGTACDFLAYYLIYIGTLRNHAFNEAVNNNIKISYGIFEVPIQIACYSAMAFGLVLLTMSFYRLGMRNMYFGDHFGFLFKERITSFPYNIVDDAQYVGTTFFFMGFSLCYHSPTGVFLTLVINVLYKVLSLVESSKLKEFYPDSSETVSDEKIKTN